MASYKDLLLQRKKLDAEIEKLREAERETVIEEIREKLIHYQISIEEIGNKKKVKGTRAAVSAKYRDPRSGKEWSGRGKPPNWIKDEPNRDKFLIK
jgi:DNA-binding protein H-NS